MTLKDIKKVACVGAGVIGASWATGFCKEGYPVNVYEINDAQVEAAKKKIDTFLQVYVDNGYMTPEQKTAAWSRLTFFTDLKAALKDVQLIQENVPEILEMKQEMAAKIDEANPTALVCSSTSGLNISDISANSKCANRYIGAHPYNPPHLMPLVEITKWEKTDPEAVQVGYDFYKAMKKEPVILNKEIKGFISNRLQKVYTLEAISLVSSGVCSVEDLDTASIFGLGIRYAFLGPHLNGHLNGGDGGLTEYYEKFHWTSRIMLERVTPEVAKEYTYKIGPEGVARMIAKRTPEQGKTRDEIIKWRDKMLMKMLELHGKLEPVK